MGLTALATLALGELGCLNFVGLSVLLAVLVELGIVAVVQRCSAKCGHGSTRGPDAEPDIIVAILRLCLGLVLAGHGTHRADAGHRRRRSVLSPSGAQSVFDARIRRVCARPP